MRAIGYRGPGDVLTDVTVDPALPHPINGIGRELGGLNVELHPPV